MTRDKEETIRTGQVMEISEEASKERMRDWVRCCRPRGQAGGWGPVLHSRGSEGAQEGHGEEWRSQNEEDEKKGQWDGSKPKCPEVLCLQVLLSPNHSRRQAGPLEGKKKSHTVSA